MMALVPWTYNNPHCLTAQADVRSFPFCGTSLKIVQDFSDEISVARNTHRKLWDGAFLLAKYLETQYTSNSSLWRRSRRKRREGGELTKVVELGSGCGLVGMTASLLGADEVRLTDDRNGLGHTRKCVETNREVLFDANKHESLSLPSAGKTISCDVLDWCDDEATWDETFAERHSFRVVLGSDIVYSNDERVLSGLVRAIDYLSNSDSLILLSYKARGLGENKFFAMAKESGFEWEMVDRSLHPREFFGSDYDIVLLKKKK